MARYLNQEANPRPVEATEPLVDFVDGGKCEGYEGEPGRHVYIQFPGSSFELFAQTHHLNTPLKQTTPLVCELYP